MKITLLVFGVLIGFLGVVIGLEHGVSLWVVVMALVLYWGASKLYSKVFPPKR